MSNQEMSVCVCERQEDGYALIAFTKKEINMYSVNGDDKYEAHVYVTTTT